MATFIGGSPAIRAVLERVELLLRQIAGARRPPTVLVEGETGTGKGLIARHLHRGGPRGQGPVIAVNCAAIPETLLESELFGFERGAFTDAHQPKAGLFQAAHGGTLFLDEVGLLPMGLQAKLLKVLDERVVRRLGSVQTTPVDVWIIAASNEDLETAVRAGRVREDFYHRIAGLIVRLPPLRERGEDIRLLAEHFLVQVSVDYGLSPKHLNPDAVAALQAYPWPGNVRELSNVIERAVLLGDGPEVSARLLALPTPATFTPAPRPGGTGPVLREAVDRFEREHLLTALEEARWNISSAADRLGVPRNTLRYRMARYGLHSTAVPPRRRNTDAAEFSVATPPGEAVAEETSLGAPQEEYRQVAWLQAILQESPESASTQTSRVRELMVDKVESFEGYVQESNSHQIFATFGLEPNEDGPRRATHAGLAICNAVSRIDPPADVRLGVVIHTMPTVMEERNGIRQLGSASRQARQAELVTLSAQGTVTGVMASSAIAPLLERWFQLEMVPDDERGVSGLMYRVLGPRQGGFAAGPAHRLSPFVGREAELVWLQGVVKQVMGDARGEVVGLVGEPGSGKSRLLHEFHQRLVGEPLT
ncbi:MAG: sigma 54-interacting transcriptional regulator, partial [bacterium]